MPDRERFARFPQEILARLRCPDCGATVVCDESELVCLTGHAMSWAGGYIDALRAPDDAATQSTAASFGYEWTTFSSIEPEDEVFWKTYSRDVPLGSLGDAIALDAGCGKGRYTYFLAPHVRAIAALESSSAVDAAVSNLSALGNVAMVRADLRLAPFAEESFDFVSCLGVLHHLADPEEGFRALVRMLAPGGRLLLYVYSRPGRFSSRSVGLAAATRMRRVSVRMPHSRLRQLSAPLAAALYAAVVVPGFVGDRLRVAPLSRLPLSTYRGKPFRSLWLDTFDRLSAPIEHRYVWEEIEPWFAVAGLDVEHVREEAGLFVLARKRGDADAT